LCASSIICILPNTNCLNTLIKSLHIKNFRLGQPTRRPTTQPTKQPSSQPSLQPSSQPSMHPSAQPSMQPSSQPSSRKHILLSCHSYTNINLRLFLCSSNTFFLLSEYCLSEPSKQPTLKPSQQPSSHPSSRKFSATYVIKFECMTFFFSYLKIKSLSMSYRTFKTTYPATFIATNKAPNKSSF
jgi:hypothetical protein